uniref:Uncharacterized protein n=1 Tax=Rhizophora mucronata TaxID=61149 RepID=A0A2P2QC36_RHIMU
MGSYYDKLMWKPLNDLVNDPKFYDFITICLNIRWIFSVIVCVWFQDDILEWTTLLVS